METMNRRQFVCGVAAAGVRAAVRGLAAPESRPPNILFIMSDDHAAHAIGAYGSRINRTPNLDRLAREGLRFDRCFCTNSICAPSRAVILTGAYSHRNGVVDNGAAFNPRQPTLQGALRGAGYQAALVGKWHLKSAPEGFDYTCILPGQGAYHDPVMLENGVARKHRGYVTDLVTDAALAWLRRRDPDRPFLLMLHHKAPHANWEPDAKHAGWYAEDVIPEPDTFDDDYRTRAAQIGSHRLKVGPQQWELHFKQLHGPWPEGQGEDETRRAIYQFFIKQYLRCVASVDENVGRVLDALDAAGLRDRTVVVYTSDQGFFLGDHGLYDKRFMYEESLRMPLLMRYPPEIAPGSNAAAMVLNLDFAPTMLDYAGVPVPPSMQGSSFRAVAAGRPPDDWRTAMYYRFYEEAYGIGPHEGIRTDRHKLIHFLYGDGGWELYDLEDDPRELHNRYGAPGFDGLAGALKKRMTELKLRYDVPPDGGAGLP